MKGGMSQVDAEAQPQGDQEVPESIGLQDLQLLANIVDLASQRGAFRGNELSQVGAVFDKLSTFLNYVAQQQAEAQDAESVDEEVALEFVPSLNTSSPSSQNITAGSLFPLLK